MASYSNPFDDGNFNFGRPAMPRGKVIIVWDYEVSSHLDRLFGPTKLTECRPLGLRKNCPVPNGMSGFTAVKMIRKAALRFGTIDHFEAYSYWSNSSNSILKQELSVSGVKLRDCPHNGRKDVVDKTIIIDMIFYALDRPLTTTVLLISGDRDYSYAISTLQNRGYSVKLLAPAGCLHSNLPLLADVLDWETVLNLPPRKTEVVEIGVSTVDSTALVEPVEQPQGSEAKNDEKDGEDSDWKITFSRYDLEFPPLPSVPAEEWSASPSPSPIIPPRSTTSDQTYSAPSISPIFEDLVAELEALKLTGYPNSLWGMVSEGLIKRDPHILAEAGVGRFKQYMELAQSCGIVQLSFVPAGRETVSLNLWR
ncbi:hypothetical protein FRC05_005688 [Tulasnella sp. 425]|nr:hypothetical protein FRC05_005688 [Tulasnella sp. 425]